MKVFTTIQTPFLALVPTCAAATGNGAAMAPRLRVADAAAALWAAPAKRHHSTNVTGSPPRGAPV